MMRITPAQPCSACRTTSGAAQQRAACTALTRRLPRGRGEESFEFTGSVVCRRRHHVS